MQGGLRVSIVAGVVVVRARAQSGQREQLVCTVRRDGGETTLAD